MKTRSRLINIFATLFVALFVLACMAGFAACGGEEPGDTPVENPNVGSSSDGDGNKDVTDETTDKASSLSSISLDTSGAKTEYTIGDEFSSAGLVVTANYADGKYKDVTDYAVDSSSYDGEKIGLYGIIVSYTEDDTTKNASYVVTVSEAPVVILLESITLDVSGAKTEYTSGDSFSSAGLKVTANYSDNSSKTVSEYTVDSSQYKGDEVGTCAIIVRYTEDGVTVSASYSVTVNEPAPTYQLIYALSLDGESYEVLGVKGEYDAVTIPAEHEGLPVTAISARAFENASITGVTIPETVASIGASAFSGCRYLASVSVPDSVTTLGERAFYDCYNLRQAVIGDGVERIGDYTFYGCSSLAKVTVGKSVDTIGSYAFCGCTSLSEIDPESSQKLTTIGEQAFCNCSSLAQIGMPDTVTTMGGACFSGCSKLESITLSFVGAEKNASNASASSLFGYIFGTTSYTGSVEINQYYDSSNSATYYIPNILKRVTVSGGKIMYGAFYGCSSLTSVTLEDSVDGIGDCAFYDCASLTNLTIGENVASIGAYAFYGCSSFMSLTIPENVKSIGTYAFYGCSSLTSITIPDGVTSIGNDAFDECTSLTSLTIGEGVESIGNYAFYGCTALTEIRFNATSMNDLSSNNYVFYNAGSASSGIAVTIGSGVTKIPAYIFYPYSSYLPKIVSVTFEEGSQCKSIGDYAFYECTSLTNITIPDSVTNMGDRAFYQCSSLKSLTIGEGIASIGEYAFCNCSSLTAVTVPDSVTSIGSAAFSGCGDLESIALPFVGGSASASSASESTLFGYIFGTSSYDGGTATTQYYSSSSYTTYYIPSNLTEVTVSGGRILYGAFYNCTSLTSVTIGENVSSIGEYAFYRCTSLTSLTIGEGVESIGSYAFYGCTALTEIRFNATSMNALSSNNYVFYNAGSASSGIAVTVGTNVTKIPAYLFNPYSGNYSPKIVSVAFEEGSKCTGIGHYAFYGCHSLTSVSIPDSVISIGYQVFYNCDSLTAVYYGGTADEWTALRNKIESGNTALTGATIYYYSETQPADSGNWWHYGEDGEIVVWESQS